MKYLVDANVLSEPTRHNPNPNVLQWLSVNERWVVVDPNVLAEIRIGILVLRSGRKRTQLEEWFDKLAGTIRCLPWDRPVGMRWARLVADLKRTGLTLPLLDSMIAATALEHGLTVVTHNVQDFRRAGLNIVDPFAGGQDRKT